MEKLKATAIARYGQALCLFYNVNDGYYYVSGHSDRARMAELVGTTHIHFQNVNQLIAVRGCLRLLFIEAYGNYRIDWGGLP